eukprot:1625109-Pyramimonas_sp.AAC.1
MCGADTHEFDRSPRRLALCRSGGRTRGVFLDASPHSSPRSPPPLECHRCSGNGARPQLCKSARACVVFAPPSFVIARETVRWSHRDGEMVIQRR